MVSADFFALLPLLVVAVSSLVVLLITAFCRDHLLVALATSLGLTVALITLHCISSRPTTSHHTPHGGRLRDLLHRAPVGGEPGRHGLVLRLYEKAGWPARRVLCAGAPCDAGRDYASGRDAFRVFLSWPGTPQCFPLCAHRLRADRKGSPRSRAQIPDPLRHLLRVPSFRHGVGVLSIGDDGIRRYGFSSGSADGDFRAIPRRSGADPDGGGFQAGRSAVSHVGA